MPPLESKRVCFILGHLWVMCCQPWPCLVKIWLPPSVWSGLMTAWITVKQVRWEIYFLMSYKSYGLLWHVTLTNIAFLSILGKVTCTITEKNYKSKFCKATIPVWTNDLEVDTNVSLVWKQRGHSKTKGCPIIIVDSYQ